ncbi:MAG TPA: hypothetical protein DCE56_29310 [Cyanobacteria bacterium UBA8553]|nr:hypothetical protein [Cyanobacteria bacterium UBA8553]HAJ63032.1 hypothetical protein [Cyanobacteria bacterium UBA8543]
MLKNTKSVNTTSVERLVKLWEKRYVPDLSTFFLQQDSLSISQLIEATSKEGRAKTAAKVQRLMQTNCECAGIRTDILFSYIPNLVNLSETQRLVQFVLQVYGKAVEIYKQQPPLSASLAEVSRPLVSVNLSNRAFLELARPALEVPAMEQFAMLLEPVIKQLREQHKLAKDKRTIGFISTQFHFSTELVLQKITPVEQVLLNPYFKFVEEQVCIPLQRVCYAAAQHNSDSPILAIVEQLLPLSREISSTVYRRATQLNPNYRSLRGKLSHPRVMASTLRDLEMLQVYLWVCILEGNMTAVEQELLPLCIMVFPSVEVTWDLVKQMLQLLMDELIARVKPAHKHRLLPYTQAMQQVLSQLETT